MTGKNQALGRWGETVAAEYLVGKGYHIEARNIRTTYGEIDLLATKEGELVFVEVKTRTTLSYGYPEEAITEKKLVHMIESAENYLQEQTDFKGNWRIDVIAIHKRNGKETPEITHFENAA